MDRQLYPDTLRAVALARIVLFHFTCWTAGWQLLSYFPSVGIMFALGGWFMAQSLSERGMFTVTAQRLARLMPTWWVFSFLTLLAGFFFASGAGAQFEASRAWFFPYESVSWSLDNEYANAAIVATWYIAAYLCLLGLSPLLMEVYKKLSWIAIFGTLFAMILYSRFRNHLELPEAVYNTLVYGACWMLGYARADGSIFKVPRYLVWLLFAVCAGCGIFLTYETGSLASDDVAVSLMSFGVAFLLLSLNPNLSFLPALIKNVISTMNKSAVTIYLFHNIMIGAAYYISSHLGYDSRYEDAIALLILIPLLILTVKTIGRIEQHRWLPVNKPTAQASNIMENGSC